MRTLGTILIVVGVLLMLPIITIPWGLAFIAVGALIRIVAGPKNEPGRDEF